MRLISLALVFILSVVTVNSSYAQSGMITTLDVMDGISLDQDREKVISFMEGKLVQEKMISMGINPQEALQRVASLSSKELKELSQKIDQAPAGGDGAGAIVGAALLVFIVLLITDILGYTKVFPFTRSIQ